MRRAPRFTIILGLVLLICSLIGFQNCSDARLRIPQSTSISSYGDPFTLNPPMIRNGHRRYIFVVDMSNSNLSGECFADVDGLASPGNYDLNGKFCKPTVNYVAGRPTQTPYASAVGSDINADRLWAVGEWIRSLRSSMTTEQQAVTKIMIVPFSGGIRDVQRDVRESGRYLPINMSRVLVDLDSASRYVSGTLTTEHNEDWRAQSVLEKNPQFMGTSVPGRRLTDVFQLLRLDMENLQNASELQWARYEVVYISDGVPRPRRRDIQNTLTDFQLQRGVSCPIVCPVNGCLSDCEDLLSTLRIWWGDFDENEIDNFIFKLQLLVGLKNYFGEAEINLNLVHLHPERISQTDRTEETNLVLAAKKSVVDAGFYELRDRTLPYQMKEARRETISYRMTSFFVINPVVRVSSLGTLSLDSDGDGLFDEDETRLGFRVNAARSPRSDGQTICLDSISANSAYRDRCQSIQDPQDCRVTMDHDGDSLNECEELILGTSKYDFDTDDDTIPDFFEVTYHFKPTESDMKLDTNNDNQPNLSNFGFGLPASVYPSQIHDSLKVLLTKNLRGHRSLVDAQGVQLDSESWDIRLENLPMRSSLVVAVQPSALKYARSPRSVISQDQSLLQGNESSRANTVVFLARAIDVDSPDRAYWWLLKRPVPLASGSNGGAGLSIGLDKMQQLPWILDRRRGFDRNE